MGFDEPCFARRATRRWRAPAFGADGRLRRAARARLGQAAAARGAVRRRRLPDAAGGRVLSRRAAGLGVPDHVPNYESAADARARAALSAGDDLAAGAQLPQLELRQRAGACATIEGEPLLEIARRRRRRARHRRRRSWCASSTTAAATVCKAAGQRRARGPASSTALGIWWRKLGARRHQRQRADAPAPDRHRPRAGVLRLPGRGRAGRRRAGVRRGAADGGFGGSSARVLLAAAHGVPDQRLQHARLLRAVGRRPPRAAAAPRGRCAQWLADAGDAAAR